MLPKLGHLFVGRRVRGSKTHNYTQYISGRDYVIEPVDGSNMEQGFYMTGHGKGIRQNDYIILSDSPAPAQYRVEKIDYYCDSSDLWIALLFLCA